MSDAPKSTPSPEDVSKEIQDKRDTAAAHKAKGNDAFKAGDLQAAMKEYHYAVLFLKGLDRSMANSMSGGDSGGTKEDLSGVDAELSLVYSNMAAIHLKKSAWARALSCCDDAIKKNPNNVKASIRKATALNGSGEVLKAIELLKTLNQKDAAVTTLQAQIAKEEAARGKKADASFRGMFESKAKVAAPSA